MPWKRLSTIVDDTRADALSELLSEHGAVSVTVEPANDEELLALYEPGPGETPMWRHARVTGLFEQASAFTAIQTAGLTSLAIDTDSWHIDTLDDQLWERAWMDDFKPIQVGPRLWVCPSWLEPPQPDAVNILMDPGLAFGSGTHPTTLLCLEWLEQQLPPGGSVIDFGCGSGILAIAALLLGADRAMGIDNDPQAIIASAENAERNGVKQGLTVSLPEDAHTSGEPCDLLLANILAAPLMQLAPQLAARVRPGGHIVLSGILASQADEVAACYAEQFDLQPIAQREDWVRLSGTRRTTRN